MSISTQSHTPVTTTGTATSTTNTGTTNSSTNTGTTTTFGGGSSGVSNGQRRNGHRHKRSFAMSGDFDFLKPELSGMGPAKSVTGNTDSDVGMTHGSRRNSRFFLSSGEETTFDEQNVPNAMIDLDDIINSFDVKSSISTGTNNTTTTTTTNHNNTHTSGRRDKGRNSYGYNNYQIRSKSNIVYSSSSSNNNNTHKNKNGGAMDRYGRSENGFMHRRSESAPADLDPVVSHLVLNDTPTTGTNTNINTNTSSSSGGGGGGDIREEENEDSSNDSSPVKSLEGRAGRQADCTQKTQKESSGMVSPEGQQKRTYRNTGRQKERYATYNSYISSVSAAIAKNSSTSSARNAHAGDLNTPSSAGNIGLEGRRSPVFYGGQRTSVGNGRRGGVRAQPFKFTTTMYDVEDTSCEATEEDKEEVREDAKEDAKEDDKEDDKEDAKEEDKQDSETEYTPPPPLVHTKSHSIAIGEQQNNLLNGSDIPASILMGEPGDIRDVCVLSREMQPDVGVPSERHVSTASVLSAHTAHTYTSVKRTESSSTLSFPQATQEETHTETQAPTGKKRRESRSSKIFNSAVSLMRSTSSLNLRDAFTTTKDTDAHADHAATKNTPQTTNDNPNNSGSLSKANRKTKLRQWLFRK